jgi:hypothetical protein
MFAFDRSLFNVATQPVSRSRAGSEATLLLRRRLARIFGGFAENRACRHGFADGQV